MSLNPTEIRAQFPALQLTDDGVPRVYLDNPGGTQMPQRAIVRMSDYLVQNNANLGGAFRTSLQTEALLAEAHAAMAALLNAASPDEVIFGPNMTTLTFALAHALQQEFAAGDEIIITRLDHDANISPWLRLAEDTGSIIRWLDFDPRTYALRMDEFEGLLSERTKLVAVGYASNAVGTINPVQQIVEMAHAASALVYVDAVQYVPHGPTDVQALGADLLACSPYKFFGPHQGVLWGKRELLNRLPAYKVRPAGEQTPDKFETGTQSHEGQAGTLGALEYLAWVGEQFGSSFAEHFASMTSRRLHLHCALATIKSYEETLSAHLISGLQSIPDVQVHGITDPTRIAQRVPTVAFTMDSHTPREIAEALARENIFVWDGHYYAVEVVRRLRLAESVGMVRVGAAHYNTLAEIDRLLEVVHCL